MSLPLIDTHCHLDVAAFHGDRLEVLARARSAGVTGIIVPGIDAEGWRGLRDLCAAESDLYPAFGLHPVMVDRHRDADLDALAGLLAEVSPVALGEIGLDFYVSGLDRDRQIALFDAQLSIARDAGLPVLLHVRKAHDQTLAMLRRTRVVGGIAHAFNGSLQQARAYLELGFKLGFGGMLTFERSTKLRASAGDLPLDAIVLETDAPDLTVASHRGERNSPEYLPEVLAALAEVRNEGLPELARRTTQNAEAVLRLRPQR